MPVGGAADAWPADSGMRLASIVGSDGAVAGVIALKIGAGNFLVEAVTCVIQWWFPHVICMRGLSARSVGCMGSAASGAGAIGMGARLVPAVGGGWAAAVRGPRSGTHCVQYLAPHILQHV